ncbi:MAG: DsrE family protein [Chitinophagaceae bacterium]|nr:DsrE family protein [Chitinophagaceae bacterium]
MRTVLGVIFFSISFFAGAQNKLNPVIADFGSVYAVPFAVEKPDPNLKYKILVDVNTGTDKPELVNESLENVARIVNLHALGNVSDKNLELALVLHGPAVFNIMNNEAYKQKFSVNNPNLPLFTALKKAGVKIFVCGQTLFKRNINPQQLAPEAMVALSAITTITTYSQKGFTVLKY